MDSDPLAQKHNYDDPKSNCNLLWKTILMQVLIMTMMNEPVDNDQDL